MDQLQQSLCYNPFSSLEHPFRQPVVFSSIGSLVYSTHLYTPPEGPDPCWYPDPFLSPVKEVGSRGQNHGHLLVLH